jgi:large subunit ribosomal protein L5
MKPGLRQRYEDEIVPALREKYNYANIMRVPHVQKIVINMGVGEANVEPRLLEAAMAELATITGQQPSYRKARKSVSNFKLREGQRIGCMVTLRGDRMYEFMERLFNMAMPRIRDFRGVSRKAFDKNGNYTLGLKDQAIFPEIDMDKVERPNGMNITFVVNNAESREESFDLLEHLGMPFQRQN